MGALITTVWRGITAMIQSTGNMLGAMWSAWSDWMTFLVGWVVAFFANATAFVIELILGMAELVVGWLPALPAAPTIGSADFLTMANAYVPVSEVMVFVGIWGAIFSGVLVVKLIRLISPVSS